MAERDPAQSLTCVPEHAVELISLLWLQGGIMGIEINWDCNLDKWFHRCSPKYSFRRLDDKTTKDYPGYNFR